MFIFCFWFGDVLRVSDDDHCHRAVRVCLKSYSTLEYSPGPEVVTKKIISSVGIDISVGEQVL